MDIIINGEVKHLAAPLGLTELVALLDLKGDGIAVELNRHIVPRERWEETLLKDDDRLEIVHFVGGG